MDLMSLTQLLGREIGDPDLEHAFRKLTIDTPVLTEVILDTHYVIAKNAGLSFVFEPENELRSSSPYPVRSGALVLANVTAYGENDQGYAEFEGELPSGLRFGASRERAHTVLGKPTWSSPIMPIDRWQRSDHRLIADFDQKTSKLATISLELP